MKQYLFVKVVTAELDSRVGDNADAVCPVSSHEAPPPFLPPHLPQCLADRQLVRISPGTLNLHQDLESLQRRHHRPGDSAGHTSTAEGGDHWLRDGFPKLQIPIGASRRLERVGYGLSRIKSISNRKATYEVVISERHCVQLT